MYPHIFMCGFSFAYYLKIAIKDKINAKNAITFEIIFAQGIDLFKPTKSVNLSATHCKSTKL